MLYQALILDFDLSKQERIIVQRGRNAGSPKKKSRGPKRLYSTSSNISGGSGDDSNSTGTNNSGNKGPSAYQDSTALEALIGYLYLTNGQRCHEVLEFISTRLDEMDNDNNNNNDNDNNNNNQ